MNEQNLTPVRPRIKAAGEPFSNPAGDTICTFPGCGRPPTRRGLCHTHYEQHRQGIELRPIQDRSPKPCSVEGCDERSRAKGLCHTHYQRLQKRKQLDAPVVRRGPRQTLYPSPTDEDRLRQLPTAEKIHLHAQMRHLRRLNRLVLGAVLPVLADQIDRTLERLGQTIRDDLDRQAA